VSLEHTDVLGDTPEQIAREKLAVAHGANVVVLPDDRYRDLVPKGAKVVIGDARIAAEAFLGRPIHARAAPELQGRLEWRGRELWDGAHNPAGTAWLRANADGPFDVAVASILRDKDAGSMLADLGALSPSLIATQSTNPRSLPAAELAELAKAHFAHVATEPDAEQALARARESTSGRILVTGSLYLLAELSA
jgi:folylpolyglutamate synthase/dihydropteroate synthase